MTILPVLQAVWLLFISAQALIQIPEVPLSEYLWQETTQEKQAALNSSFIQGLKTLSLDPTAFGAYMVQDAVYCYKSKVSIDIAASKTNNPILKQFLLGRAASYERLYKSLFKDWHIHNQSGISLGAACQGYVNHIHDVATSMHPVYLVTAIIPCVRLWPWIGEQIKVKKGTFGVYTTWVTADLSPDYHGYDKYEKVINDAYRNGGIDRQTALHVYQRSMQGEAAFFSSV